MQARPDNDLLRGTDLHHAHQGSPALCEVSLTVREHEVLGVIGPRAAGKTTLLKCLSGQITPDGGEISFRGFPVHTLKAAARERLRRDHFGWVGPAPRLIPELTVGENTALPLLLAGTPHRVAVRTAREWLARLDVAGAASQRPGRLTPAQRQRVAVARALVGSPDVLFADEPTAGLRQGDRLKVLRALTNAARTHRITVVLATDDPSVAAFADRTFALVDGAHVVSPPVHAWPEGAPC